MGRLKLMHLDYGVLIEARGDAEMPEVMAFACTLHRLRPERAVPFAPALAGCVDGNGVPY
eukprot:scaffold13707_cov118-Isochrysis_galbana.AAC.1